MSDIISSEVFLSNSALSLIAAPNISFANSTSTQSLEMKDVHYQLVACIKKSLTEQSRKIMAGRHSKNSVSLQRRIKKVTSLQRFLSIIGPKN